MTLAVGEKMREFAGRTPGGRIVDIRVDEVQLLALTQQLGQFGGQLGVVVSRALNKVAASARAEIVRRVSREVNLRPKQLRDHNVRLFPANRRTWLAQIQIRGRRIPLIAFAARQTRRGVSYAIRRGQRRTIEHAFINVGKTDKQPNVLLRVGEPRISRRAAERTDRRAGRVKGMGFLTRPRYPIFIRYGPSVPQVVADIAELSAGVYDRKLAERLGMELDRQVGVLLEQKGRAARGGEEQ